MTTSLLSTFAFGMCALMGHHPAPAPPPPPPVVVSAPLPSPGIPLRPLSAPTRPPTVPVDPPVVITAATCEVTALDGPAAITFGLPCDQADTYVAANPTATVAPVVVSVTTDAASLAGP
jgi:hypothetical protein